MGEAVAGYAEINKGIKGVEQGVGQLKDGSDALNQNVKNLPENVSPLIDGQTQLKEGVEDAQNQIRELTGADKEPATPVSFAAGEKVAPLSVQFVMMTDAISKTETVEAVAPAAPQLSLWDRILNLFR